MDFENEKPGCNQCTRDNCEKLVTGPDNLRETPYWCCLCLIFTFLFIAGFFLVLGFLAYSLEILSLGIMCGVAYYAYLKYGPDGDKTEELHEMVE